MSLKVSSPIQNDVEPPAQSQDTQQILVEDEQADSAALVLYLKSLDRPKIRKRQRCISAEIHKILHS